MRHIAVEVAPLLYFNFKQAAVSIRACFGLQCRSLLQQSSFYCKSGFRLQNSLGRSCRQNGQKRFPVTNRTSYEPAVAGRSCREGCKCINMARGD